MRLKTWLLISYFIVMTLPLVAAYVLFAWISSYNNELQFEEFIDTSIDMQEIITVLDDPAIYHPKVAKEKIDPHVSTQQSVTLYNERGLIIYTSNPGMNSGLNLLGKVQLYEGLYKLEQGFSTNKYKQPVFDDQTLIGFFQIELARGEWTAGVVERSWLMLGIFVIFFGLIYFLIARLVNRKLNHRLTELMGEMTSFAQGITVDETEANNDEIGQLKQHFYAMRKQINLAQEAIKKEQQEKEYMVATISHDLKTPLTSIKAYAEAIDNGHELTTTEQSEYRKVILDKADFMKQMLDDLLTYTLLQSPAYEMDLVPVEGAEFFDMLISDYEGLCKGKNITLHAISNVTGTYQVNPKQMMRVADNLMSNAIQYTTYGGVISLVAISDLRSIDNLLFAYVKESIPFDFNNYVYLIVQNEGEGITESKLTEIFDPLYQVDEARSKQDDHGTGLGLSITKQIMEKHGGDVEVISRENVGTTVICRLPKDKEREQ